VGGRREKNFLKSAPKKDKSMMGQVVELTKNKLKTG